MFQPTAVGHDKRLGKDCGRLPSSAEKYRSAEAALMMTRNWSRGDVTEQYLEEFKRNAEERLLRPTAEFERGQSEGRLPAQVNPEQKVGLFVNGNCANRFRL